MSNTLNNVLEIEKEEILNFFEEEDDNEVLQAISIKSFSWKQYNVNLHGDFNITVLHENASSPDEVQLFTELDQALDYIAGKVVENYTK
jgi:hypothetical protein